MEIIRGKLKKPITAVVYGVEGVGKSLFASLWPKPIFVDVENSSARLDVPRVTPATWTGVMQTLDELNQKHQNEFKTTVLDTADWAEQLAIQEVCAANGYTALGGQDDFGRSYNLLETAWCKMLDQLTIMNEAGWNCLILAHAHQKTVQQPEEIGAYSKWELALEKKTAKKLKEWPEMLLFLNFRTRVVEDSKTKTKKGTGGQRVAYSTHSPCWDAKNRLGLPNEFDFEFENGVHQGWEAIKHLFVDAPKPAPPEKKAPEQQPSTPPPPAERPALNKLLTEIANNGLTWEQVQAVIAKKGFYPATVKITALADDFIEGKLIPTLPNIAAAYRK